MSVSGVNTATGERFWCEYFCIKSLTFFIAWSVDANWSPIQAGENWFKKCDGTREKTETIIANCCILT